MCSSQDSTHTEQINYLGRLNIIRKEKSALFSQSHSIRSVTEITMGNDEEASSARGKTESRPLLKKQDSLSSVTDDAEHGYTAKNHKRHFVHHDYHDHSDEIDTDKSHIEGTNAGCINPIAQPLTHPTDSGSKNKKGGVNMPFPEKLHGMLDRIEQDGFAHVISWQPHGRAFIVHKHKEFVDIIMPRYFRQSKISSFQRQLNLYGFCRLTRGRDKGAYYHELFLRGRLFLCRRMTRTRIKGTGIKASSSPDTEPNFYLMKPCFPESGSNNITSLQMQWSSQSSSCSPHTLPEMTKIQANADTFGLSWNNFKQTPLSVNSSSLSSSPHPACVIQNSNGLNFQTLNWGDGGTGHMIGLSVPVSDHQPVQDLPLDGCLASQTQALFRQNPSESVTLGTLKPTDMTAAVPFSGSAVFETQSHVSPITSRLLDPLVLQRIRDQNFTSKLSGINESRIEKQTETVEASEAAFLESVEMNPPIQQISQTQELFKSPLSNKQSPNRLPVTQTSPSPHTSAETFVKLSEAPAEKLSPMPLLEIGQNISPCGSAADLGYNNQAPTAKLQKLDQSMMSGLSRRTADHQSLEVSRALRRLSLISLSDVSLFEAERRDCQVMDEFFAEFEDGEMAPLIDVVAAHDTDEVLGDMLDQMMDAI